MRELRRVLFVTLPSAKGEILMAQKALGKTDRVGNSLNMNWLIRMFLDDEASRKWIENNGLL